MIEAFCLGIAIIMVLILAATIGAWIFATLLSVVFSVADFWRALRNRNRMALCVSISLAIWVAPWLLVPFVH
jgi:hypothetical protein